MVKTLKKTAKGLPTNKDRKSFLLLRSQLKKGEYSERTSLVVLFYVC